MKRKNQLFITAMFALLGHYFVLHFFTLDMTHSQVAVVEKTQYKGKGLFQRASIVFNVTENKNGKNIKKQRTVSTWNNNVSDLKSGKKYFINTQNNWLVSYSVDHL